MSGSHNQSESTSLAHRETKPGYHPPADAPHHLRQTDRDPRAAKRAERQVALMFTGSMLLTVAAIIAFVLIPSDATVRLPGIGEPAELAELMAWLLSAHAARVTGQVWALDGGFSSIRPLVRGA